MSYTYDFWGRDPNEAGDAAYSQFKNAPADIGMMRELAMQRLNQGRMPDYSGAMVEGMRPDDAAAARAQASLYASGDRSRQMGQSADMMKASRDFQMRQYALAEHKRRQAFNREVNSRNSARGFIGDMMKVAGTVAGGAMGGPQGAQMGGEIGGMGKSLLQYSGERPYQDEDNSYSF